MTNRIVILLDGSEMGGAERQGILLAEQLRNHGMPVCIAFLTRAPGAALDRAQAKGLLVWRFPRVVVSRNFGQMLRFAYLVFMFWRLRVSCIIPFCDNANVIGVAAGLALGLPHRVWNQRDGGLKKRGMFAQLMLSRSHCVIANSWASVEWLRGAKVRKFVVIPNGIEVISDRDDVYMQPVPQVFLSGCRHIAMVANLHPGKRQDLALTALAAITHEFPDVALLLIGREDGEHGGLLRNLTDRLGIQSRVRFLGFQSDPLSILKRSDLHLFPYALTEGLPNALLEGLLHGVPTLTFDSIITRSIPRVPWLHLVPFGDEKAMYKALRSLLDGLNRVEVSSSDLDRLRRCYAPQVMMSRFVQECRLVEFQ